MLIHYDNNTNLSVVQTLTLSHLTYTEHNNYTTNQIWSKLN